PGVLARAFPFGWRSAKLAPLLEESVDEQRDRNRPGQREQEQKNDGELGHKSFAMQPAAEVEKERGKHDENDRRHEDQSPPPRVAAELHVHLLCAAASSCAFWTRRSRNAKRLCQPFFTAPSCVRQSTF